MISTKYYDIVWSIKTDSKRYSTQSNMPNESKWWDSQGLSYSGQESCRERCCRFTWHGTRPQNHRRNDPNDVQLVQTNPPIFGNNNNCLILDPLCILREGFYMILPWHADLVTFDALRLAFHLPPSTRTMSSLSPDLTLPSAASSLGWSDRRKGSQPQVFTSAAIMDVWFPRRMGRGFFRGSKGDPRFPKVSTSGIPKSPFSISAWSNSQQIFLGCSHWWTYKTSEPC